MLPSPPVVLRCAIALVVAGGLALPPVARAAPADDAAEQFDQAELLYREGRYDEAIAILRELIAAYPEPILRFNLGRAYESAGRLEEAIDAYERYLEASPDAPDRVDVEGRIGRLQTQLAAQEPEPEPEPDPEPPSPPPDKPIIAPWVLAGVGGAGLALGVTFGSLSRARSNEARDAQTDQVRATAALDEARRFATVANVSLAVGGALAVAGLAWGIAAVAKRKRSKTSPVAWRGSALRF